MVRSSIFSQLISRFVLTSVDILKVKAGVTKIVNRITIGVNIFLYIIFCVLVLVFQYEKDGTATTCGAKYLAPPDNSVKRITTIFYASFIALFSFALCLGLAVFGTRFVRQQTRRAKKFNMKSSNTRIRVGLSVTCYDIERCLW
jgi:hypothetical protein